jgi:hypothetical protein
LGSPGAVAHASSTSVTIRRPGAVDLADDEALFLDIGQQAPRAA